ncbi:MAG: ComEC/Rec2 family competence protein [Planctomycetota bacterium]
MTHKPGTAPVSCRLAKVVFLSQHNAITGNLARVGSPASFRRAALPVALALIGGIVLSTHIAPWPWVALAIATMAFVISLAGRSTTILLLGFAALGFAAAQHHWHRYAPNDVAHFTTAKPQLVRVRLRLDEPPRVRIPDADAMIPMPPMQNSIAEVVAIETIDGWANTRGSVLLNVRRVDPRLAAGQTIEALALLRRPAPAMNPGQFDWSRHYRADRILAGVSINGPDQLRIIDTAAPPLRTAARAFVRQRLTAGFDDMDVIDAALLTALILGERDPLMSDVADDFRAIGAGHHLAISGMHVAIMGGFVFLVARLTQLPPRPALLAATVFVLAYGWLAQPTPSVARAVILWSAFAVGLLLRHKADPLQSLSVAAIIVLLLQPHDLFSAGFQLSFGTVFGLLVLTPIVVERVTEWARPDDAYLASGWSVAARWFDNKTINVVAATLVAWAVSMPLVAWHFGQLNPWGVAGSILLSGPTMLALCVGLLKVLASTAVPWGDALWADLAAIPAGWMRSSAASLSGLPAADVPLPQPALLIVLIYFAALAAAVRKWPTGTMRWSTRGALAAATFVLIVGPYLQRKPALTIAAPQALAGEVDEVRVTVLAVGAGQCVVIETPQRRTWLIDAGSATMSDPMGRAIGPYLRRAKLTAIEGLLITHANADHYGAAGDVATRYAPGTVLVGPRFIDDAQRDPAGLAVLRQLNAADLPPTVVSAGERVPLGRNAYLEVLWPPVLGEQWTANDTSLVVRLHVADRTMLFAGDIENAAMGELLRSAADLSADVLLAPHHGSAEELTPKFLEAVDPNWIVSSDDATPTRKQKAFEALVGDRPLLRTGRDGAITIGLGLDGSIRVEPFLK